VPKIADPALWSNAVIEIHRLHTEILSHARTSLDKAIRIGELLITVKDTLKHGEWHQWIEDNAPFSRKTSDRYIFVFERRDELKKVNVTHLTDAYALMLTHNGNGNGNEPQQLHEPNFHSKFVHIKQEGLGLFNHWIQRRPLNQWNTEELFDTLASVEPWIAIRDSIKQELSTRPDVPRGY
jgi:hypothetical protein